MAKDTFASRAQALTDAQAALEKACRAADGKWTTTVQKALDLCTKARTSYMEKVEAEKARLDRLGQL